MKTLYLVRHAKAEELQVNQTDFERQLTHRGEDQATQISKLLKDKVDLIIASPAARTLKTAQIIATGIHYPLNEITLNPSIFEANLNNLSKVISTIEDKFKSAMLVGHNPGISLLAQKLCPEVKTELPTCAVVILTFAQESWIEVTNNIGILSKLIQAR